MKRHVVLVTLVVLVLGLVNSAAVARWTYESGRVAGDIEFQRRVERLVTEIQRRVNLSVYGLMGARGVYMASEAVSRGEFTAYVDSRDLPREFPGAIGFGFIQRVMRDDLEAFVAAEQADEAPDFAIRSSGDASDLYVIKYIVPLERNRPAWGYDVGSEPSRRETVERAIRTGNPTLTPPIDLVQEDAKVAGFLYLVPVYEKHANPTSPEERFASLVGLVYAPIVINETFRDISSFTEGLVQFELFNGESSSGQHIYSYRGGDALSSGAAPESETNAGDYFDTQLISVGGRTWTVAVTSTVRFDAMVHRSTPLLVGLSGILLTLMFAALVWTLAVSRARALDIAHEMTSDLAKSESQFRSLVNNIPGTSYRCLMNSDWTMLFISDAVQELTGYPAADFLGYARRTFASIIHPDDREAVAQEVAGATARRLSYTVIYRICHADGSERWVRERGKAHFRNAGDGDPEYLEGVIFDITDQVEAEESLSAEQARLTAFVRHAPAAVAMFDAQVRYVAFSERWLKDYGLEGQDILGRCHYDIFPAMPERWKQIHARCLAGAVERAESDEWRPDGWDRDQVLRWEVRPWYDGFGEIAGIMMFTQDITQDKILERALEERNASLSAAMVELSEARRLADAANQSKSEFLANMSHEIRTPLTAIVGYADILREEGALENAPPRRVDAVNTIQRAGQHLLMIINDILDISKIEAGKLTVEAIETDAIRVLLDADTLMRPRAEEKGVALRTRLLSPVPNRIVSDPTRLRQIFMNVVGNAAKFTDAGFVEIRIARHDGAEGDTLRVEVEDTGPGMSPEQASALFSPFTQADNTLARKYGGTGLGLTISRRLAGLMGGSLEIGYTELGRGSCFVLNLPLVPAPGATDVTDLTGYVVDDSGAESEEITLSGSILLVEDNAVNQRLISHHLVKAGANVSVADNGFAALDMLSGPASEGRSFDLVVSDMQMPEMDGYTLARQIRSAGGTIPIVALTAQAMAEDRQACLDAGCNDYTTKPIDKHVLLRICRRWLSAPRYSI